jgi:hypothetical protein
MILDTALDLVYNYIMKKRVSTIYVAGPMRGYDDYNYPAFDRQARVLEKQGWKVINPAEMDRDDEKPISGRVARQQTFNLSYAGPTHYK